MDEEQARSGRARLREAAVVNDLERAKQAEVQELSLP
jgi:hypothetical protein